MTDRELVQMALDALDIACRKYGEVGNINTDWGQWDSAMTALRARLAQPEPEPVAWIEFDSFMDEDGLMSERKIVNTWDNGRGEPLYTAPPQREWQGLTDDERTFLAWESNNGPECVAMTEAKLKEKNAC